MGRRGELSAPDYLSGFDIQYYTITLIQLGLTDEPSHTVFKGYQICFGVDPYPESGVSIPEESYRIVLIVNR
jgi:hypothetical protein